MTPAAASSWKPALAGVAVAALLLLAAADSADAHRAPPPKDAETRVLHDHNDDCGGHTAEGLASTCDGTHDLIALDVREAWDPDLGQVIVLRLIMDHGEAGPQRDVVTMRGGGSTHTFVLTTSDDKRFTGTGFDRVGAAKAIGDGTRFAVEGTAALSRLGLAPGDTLSDFFVQASRSGTAGDRMPGNDAGPVDVQGEEKTDYKLASYRLAGPTQYVSATLETRAVQMDPGQRRLVNLDLNNLLRDQAQVVELELAGAAGVRAGFHDPADGGDGTAPTLEVSLDKGKGTLVHVVVEHGEPGATGVLAITATTDAGGRTEAALGYGVGAPPPTPAATDGQPPGKESPTPWWLAAGALIVSCALRRRG